MAKKWTVYISGTLTVLSEDERERLRHFYESLAAVCRNQGFDAYLPHKFSDPVKHAHITPAQVDRFDRLAVTTSDLVVAYVGIPAIGVGVEIEMAFHAHKPVVLLHEKDRLVTKMALGSPGVIQTIVFDSEEDARCQLSRFLTSFIEKTHNEGLPDPLSIVNGLVRANK